MTDGGMHYWWATHHCCMMTARIYLLNWGVSPWLVVPLILDHRFMLVHTMHGFGWDVYPLVMIFMLEESWTHDSTLRHSFDWWFYILVIFYVRFVRVNVEGVSSLWRYRAYGIYMRVSLFGLFARRISPVKLAATIFPIQINPLVSFCTSSLELIGSLSYQFDRGPL